MIKNKDKLPLLFSILVFAGFFGFIYEVIFYYINGGMQCFYWRGTNFLPWINIYAYGALLILLFAYKHKKRPIRVFLASAFVCGVLEYFSGLILYKLMDGFRAWNYDKEILGFGSINGFVCFRSVLFFGISGVFLIYIVVPILNYINKINWVKVVSCVLFIIIMLDEGYNLVVPKVTTYPSSSDIYKKFGIQYVDSN